MFHNRIAHQLLRIGSDEASIAWPLTDRTTIDRSRDTVPLRTSEKSPVEHTKIAGGNLSEANVDAFQHRGETLNFGRGYQGSRRKQAGQKSDDTRNKLYVASGAPKRSSCEEIAKYSREAAFLRSLFVRTIPPETTNLLTYKFMEVTRSPSGSHTSRFPGTQRTIPVPASR